MLGEAGGGGEDEVLELGGELREIVEERTDCDGVFVGGG